MKDASDLFGHPKYGFALATLFAALHFAGLLLNSVYKPARDYLAKLDSGEYREAES